MAYSMFLDGVQLPITPSKVILKVKNQNKTITLINDGEINFLKTSGLTDISFDAPIPHTDYPMAVYPSGFKSLEYFLNHFERLKTSKKPFQFIVSRTTPGHHLLFDTNMKVSLEDYQVTEKAEDGFDLVITVKLKQWRDYGTKTISVTTRAETKVATVTTPRETTSAPKAKTHTVVSGDCLYNIAKKHLGDGSRYPEIYSLNQTLIDGGNKGTGNPKYTIYPGQVLTIPS